LIIWQEIKVNLGLWSQDLNSIILLSLSQNHPFNSKKLKISRSLLGSAFAFILATSCCWMPAMAFILGSSAALTFLSKSLDTLSWLFYALGIGLLCYAGFKFFQKKQTPNTSQNIELQSLITCPDCGFSKMETMPTDACQFFYECSNCKKVLKPKKGDCCVYCSFGTVKCPPIQAGISCC
jgi:hypothetical protein